jgi:predicted helicase
LFLKEYDAKKRMQRGVFYTPRPVVSYIVRSVDELLRTEFGLEDGLADTTTWGEMAKRHKDLKIPEGTSPEQAFVQILDPATGTGTFLVEVIDIIHKTMVAKWKAQGHGEKKIAALWNEYLPKHLLPRLHAYELLMAPYAIAHLKVGLKLYETGYRFGSDERARIYLTNALEPAHDFSGTFEFAIPALAHEAQAVNEIKRKQRFTVVIGNPPYSNFGQLNRVSFILDLLDDYKKSLGERKLNLDDDYIKFIRLGQWVIDQTHVGLLAYISANSYLGGAGHRKMRQLLLASFDKLRVLNLHGNLRKKEHTPDGDKDENVFDIMQGVAIGLMRKTPSKKLGSRVDYADLWGTRQQKYAALGSTSVGYEEIHPEAELFLLIPQTSAFREEYGCYAQLKEIFHDVGQGIEMGRTIALASSKTEIAAVISDLKTLTELTFSRKYDTPVSSATWGIERARQDVCSGRGRFMKLMVRPFDEGWTYYTGRAGGFHHRPRAASTANMLLNGNRALVAKRQSKEANFTSVWVVDKPINQGFFSIDPLGRESLFPVYRVRDASADEPSLWSDSETAIGNLRSDFLNDLPSSDSADGADVRALEYIYAVLHSPTYRERYGEYLRTDFPRVPRPTSLGLYRALFRLGSSVIAVHLMESPNLEHFITTYSGPKNPEVGRIGWSNDTVWLDAAATKKGQPATPGTIGFRSVPEAVWNFHIGGYQVCEKWLKDRKGRTLSKDDIAHYQKIVVALNETIRLMQEIDAVIEQHGGWPGAFQTGEAQAAAPKVIPFRPRIVQPGPKERYVTCVPLVPLKVAAGAFSDPQHIDEDHFEWTAVETNRRLRAGMFVAQVVGKSMEPAIPDGAYCLFAAPVEGTRQGKTVLVQLRDATDPESGERYTVKRYESEKAQAGDSWRHERITLKPVNPDFKPIVLTGADEGQLQVVAEFVDVLGGES